MAPPLTLFPSRIRFVNADGTLTPEAYRALQSLVERVGGGLGDNGVDVFGLFSSSTESGQLSSEMMSQPVAGAESAGPDIVSQPSSDMAYFSDVMQQVNI